MQTPLQKKLDELKALPKEQQTAFIKTLFKPVPETRERMMK